MLTPEREDGFTLIELLLTVVLLGVVGSAIASSMLVMLSTKKSAEGMLAVSRDRQFVTNYFSDDVAGAHEVLVPPTPPPAVAPTYSVCGSTVEHVVVLKGTDVAEGSTTSVDTVTGWWYAAPTGELRRTSCRGGGPAQTRTVARNVVAKPTVATPCAGSSAPDVSLVVPQPDMVELELCALRRPE